MVEVRKRGRPKKQVAEPVTNVEQWLAEKLYSHCDIPGCKVDWHVEDAKDFISQLKQEGYVIIKEKI